MQYSMVNFAGTDLYASQLFTAEIAKVNSRKWELRLNFTKQGKTITFDFKTKTDAENYLFDYARDCNISC